MSDFVEFTLLENGLDYLLSSIESLPLDKKKTGLVKKTLKYSILHLFAALEIFLKKRLENENWIYIFDDMNKADRTKYDNKDFKSVDLETSIQRLEKLVGVVFTDSDKAILRRFRMKRNKIQHYDYKDTIIALEMDILNVVKITVSFISANLIDLIDTDKAKTTLETIQSHLVKLDKYSNELENIATKRLEKDNISDDKIVQCPHCLEDFFFISSSVEKLHFCYYCNWSPITNNGYREIAESYIEKFIGSIDEMCRDDEQVPLYSCLNCRFESLVIHGKIAHCFHCCEDFPDVAFCNYCGDPIRSVSEESISICPTCVELKSYKD